MCIRDRDYAELKRENARLKAALFQAESKALVNKTPVSYTHLAKEAHFDHQGIRYELVDLPGTYSLSPYSPEELYIRDYLTNEETRPDVVIDVLDATNLERQLYLAVQVREMGIPMVIALNMWDEFEQKKNQLDVQQLSHLLGAPMVPTICRKGVGICLLYTSY